MKNLVFVCVALFVVGCMVGSVSSAADKTVSATTIDSLGLTGMTLMSDSEGLAIRGKGAFLGHCITTITCKSACNTKSTCEQKSICRPTICKPCPAPCKVAVPGMVRVR
jgi:hypothetical protein